MPDVVAKSWGIEPTMRTDAGATVTVRPDRSGASVVPKVATDPSFSVLVRRYNDDGVL